MNHFAKITESLETQGLDAMLLTCEANRFYASGFHSSGTDGIALVTRRHNYYFTDSRYTEAAARSVQNAEIREANRQHPYSALINAVIDAEGLKRIGYEDEYVTVADWRRYTEKLHGELVPASALLWQLRAVKDAEERDCLIQAQRIAERALTETLNDIRPGVPEREIAALLLYRMLHYGAEDKSFDPIVVSGPNGSLPHGVPGDKPIQAGEFVTMDFGCKYGGYCSDMTRTVAVGHVTEEMDTVYHTVLQAQLAGIAAARAGRQRRGGGRRRPDGHRKRRLRRIFRPQLRPRRRRRDSRKPQRLPRQRAAPARRGSHQRGAGHLSAGEAGRPH